MLVSKLMPCVQKIMGKCYVSSIAKKNGKLITTMLQPIAISPLIFRTTFSFCKSQTYVDHYNTLRTEIKQKKDKVKELQQKLLMLHQMSEQSTSDQLLSLLYSLFGQSYETKAFKQHKEILIDLRNILEKRIEQSSIKWEQPRKLILEERSKKIIEFMEAIIGYQTKLALFIKQRESNKAEHLADINEGLVLTHKLLIKNIEKEGGVQVWPQKDQLFNENQHQSVNRNTTQKNAKIQSLVLPGWKLKDNVIRKAKVTVY